MVLAYNIKEMFFLQHHASRVGDLAHEIACRLNLGELMCMKAFLAGTYHDIGKMFIPDIIISKVEPLTVDEFEEVKKHVDYGCDFLAAFNLDPDIYRAIWEHHEHLDGSGYPHGLKGDQISLLGKIIAVADKFDALTSDRVYRHAFSFKEALSMLRASVLEGKLDGEVVAVLCRFVICEGDSNHIILNEFIS